MRRIFLALTGLSLLMTGGAAHASSGRVTVSYAVHYAEVGGGYVVVSVCEATADPHGSSDTALVTTVSCGVNGAQESQTTPGPKSVVTGVAAAVMPIVLCYSANATFMGATGTYDTTVGPICVQIAPRP